IKPTDGALDVSARPGFRSIGSDEPSSRHRPRSPGDAGGDEPPPLPKMGDPGAVFRCANQNVVRGFHTAHGRQATISGRYPWFTCDRAVRDARVGAMMACRVVTGADTVPCR